MIKFIVQGDWLLYIHEVIRDERHHGRRYGDIYVEGKLVSTPDIPSCKEHEGETVRATIHQFSDGHMSLLNVHV